MRSARAGITLVVAALAVASRPTLAEAQTDLSAVAPGPRRIDVSGAGGFLLSTDWSDLVLLGAVSPVSGALEQVLARDLVVRPGPVFDAVVTYWEGRYGFRTHVGFAQSCLTAGSGCHDVPGATGASSSVDVKSWTYDIGGAIGLIDYRRGMHAWPYVFLGFGGVTYDLDRTAGPPLTFLERSPPAVPNPRVTVSRDIPDPALIVIDELNLETKFAVNLGVGTDFRLPLGPASLGLRLEVSDHLHRSPIDVLVVPLDRSAASRGETQLDFGFVHNLRAAGGLVVQFGR
jgi:hypothetical protein